MGFPQSSKYKDLKVLEPIAQVTAKAVSTMQAGIDGEYNADRERCRALGDSNTGMYLTIGILAALVQREKTGEVVMYISPCTTLCLNLCRIKTRDQLTR